MPSLPTDIIIEVLDLSTNATLALCAVVCQDLSELSRSRLYKSVTIANGNIATAPEDIATTSSHLLQYVRHLEISFTNMYDNRSATRRLRLVQIFQKLVCYGNLTAIWFNFQAMIAWERELSNDIPHLVPFLQMESVKYIRAPLISPWSSGYEAREEKDFLEGLFLSNACLDLSNVPHRIPSPPQLYLPSMQSHKPSIHTLRLDWQQGVEDFGTFWKWFTSHVDLRSHLRRLQISINLDHLDAGRGILSDLAYSLPKCLSELSMYSTPNGHLNLFLSKFPIQYFHSLNYLSLSFFMEDKNNRVDSHLTALIQFMQRVSPSSRDTLREIHFSVILFGIRLGSPIPDAIMMKWKTLGEVIDTFPSSPQTTIYVSPEISTTVNRFSESFISGLPTARKGLDFPLGRLSMTSAEYRRDVMFGWEQANEIPEW